MSAAGWALCFCLAALALNLGSILFAMLRCRAAAGRQPPGSAAPPISIIRPLCGLDNFLEETLASAFALDYPCYEILFCVATSSDPAIPVVRALMAAHRRIPARLLIGDDRVNGNPKLNNCLKGWRAARYEWIVLTDANVLMPPDYLQRMIKMWSPDTGLVCSTPIGIRPASFSAEVECAFLNTFQARWHYVSESLGFAFVQGKNMLWRREVLEPHGGLAALASELAEDAAATKIIARVGLRVRLVETPFEQPLGRRTWREVWKRQLRWARLRRATFPLFFLPEIGGGPLLPVLAACYAAISSGFNAAVAALAILTLWYGAESLLARRAGWYFGWKSPLAFLARDLAMPAIWISAWMSDKFDWRGTPMSVSAIAPASSALEGLVDVDEASGAT